MSVQERGLQELLAAFKGAQRDAPREVRKVVARGALAVKTGMAKDARVAAPVHAPYFPRSISYDVQQTPAGADAEIGPDKDRAGAQGALGNLLAFGSRNNAPVWDHAAALEAEGPVVERYLGEVGERLLS